MIEYLINYIILTFILFYFIIASIEDIKKREVYDYINYSLSFLMISIGIFHSIVINSFEPIKLVGFGLLLGFLFGSILYYLGIWGGGDAKFLIGFSASSYYLLYFIKSTTLIPFLNSKITLEKISEIFLFNFGEFIKLFFQFFLKIILVLDILFLLFIVFSFIKTFKDKKQVKNLSVLSSILLFLFSGLYFYYSSIILILIGFICFILLFFADDEIFNSVYIKIKKSFSELVVGDLLVENIKFNKKNLVSKENFINGLEQNDISLISKYFKNEKKQIDFEIKKILPYSFLIGLNFVLYLIKIVNLNSKNVEILFFQLRFLFISFLIGGIITLGIIFFLAIRNYKKLKISVSKFTKYSLFFSLILITIFSLLDRRFIILYSLILIYVILKIGRAVENLVFVKKKEVNKIVPGDWIVEDIIVENKKIYSVEEFKLGVNENQLKKIKQLGKKYKSFNFVLVKDGIAFIPPLFIGFLILLLI